MSDTPPMADVALPSNGRDKTPELVSHREKRRREDEGDDRDGSSRSHRRRERDERDDRDLDRERERERRHRRHREDETEEERRERHRRRDEETEEERRERHRRRDEKTEEEREERRRRRREREREREQRGPDDRDRERERERDSGRDRDSRRDREREVDVRRRESREMSIGKQSTHRDRSRESHRSSSHRPRDDGAVPAIKEMSREEKEAERERRDREMALEKREAARLREERFAEMDRERERERRSYGRSPRDYSPPRRRRGSPMYDVPPPRDRDRRDRERSRDPATALLDEVDSASRSILVTQLSAKMTSQDLGMFFEDKLGRGAIRDARVVMDKVSRRSKGAVALSGTLVMGLPISIMPSEAERNQGGPVQSASITMGAPAQAGAPTVRPPIHFGSHFPPLSTGLAIPPGVDVDAHREAAIPFHGLYISNVAFSLSADDLRQVFEPFGELEFVDLHVDFSGMRKGTAYVQFKTLTSAQMALDAMANFELAGRPIRVQTVQDRAYVANEQIEDNGNYGTRLDATQRQQLMFKLARTEPNVNLSLSAHQPAPAPSKSPAMNPTTFLVVNNMFNPDEETERNWDLDLAEDVKTEVETKYGKVNRIKVEKMSAGEVYIEFDNLNGAGTALRGLNGRFFGGRQLQASYISETLFKAHL